MGENAQSWRGCRRCRSRQWSRREGIAAAGSRGAAGDITRDTKAFTTAIRTRIFSFLRAVANEDYEAALENLASPARSGEAEPWTPARLKEAVERFYADHRRICLDPNARNQRHTYVIPS